MGKAVHLVPVASNDLTVSDPWSTILRSGLCIEFWFLNLSLYMKVASCYHNSVFWLTFQYSRGFAFWDQAVPVIKFKFHKNIANYVRSTFIFGRLHIPVFVFFFANI